MKNTFINNNFFLIWSGKLVSIIGDKFYMLVLALWVLKKTNSPSIMGIVLIASALPAFIVSFFSGAFVDILNKKRIIILTDFLRGFFILIVVILEYYSILEVWHIIVISIISSILNGFFDPAINSIIPEVVEEKDLPSANALNQLVYGISTVLGPILGAFALSVIGFAGGFLINGISFIMSALFEAGIKYKHKPIKNLTKSDIISDIKEGFSFVLSNQILIKVILIIALVHFAFGSFILIIPFLASSISSSSINLGLLQAFLGAGLILGASKLNIKNLKINKKNLLFQLIILLGVALLLIGVFDILSWGIVPLIIVFAVIGLIISNASSFWQLLLQLSTPKELRGRVFGIVSILSNISIPFAYATIGFLLEFIDYSTYLIILSVILIVSAIIINGKISFISLDITEKLKTKS